MQDKYTVLFTEPWDAGQALTTTFRYGAGCADAYARRVGLPVARRS
jgi:hypothetical protein